MQDQKEIGNYNPHLYWPLNSVIESYEKYETPQYLEWQLVKDILLACQIQDSQR